MNSEHQDGKTEPASLAKVWGFGLGKFGGLDQLRNAVNQLQSLLYAF